MAGLRLRRQHSAAMKSIWESENRRTRKRKDVSNDPAYEPERKRLQREVFESWDDETRAVRAVGFGLWSLEWSVPCVHVPDFDIVNVESDYDGYGATETIGRWRKSTAKTEHAARLCLQIELEESVT